MQIVVMIVRDLIDDKNKHTENGVAVVNMFGHRKGRFY